MRMRTAVAAGLTGFVGAAGAVVGFQQLAPTAGTEAAASTGPSTVASDKARTTVRFERCPAGFALEGKACVREVERTVVVDVVPPARGGAPPAAGEPVAGSVPAPPTSAAPPVVTVAPPAVPAHDDPDDDWHDDDWHDDDWHDDDGHDDREDDDREDARDDDEDGDDTADDDDDDDDD
jgi:hypothetical protein